MPGRLILYYMYMFFVFQKLSGGGDQIYTLYIVYKIEFI